MAEARIDSILRFTSLYGLSTVEALHRSVFGGEEVTAKAVERCLTRGMKEGLLRSYPLHGKTRYYVATVEGERRLGVESKRAGRPFGWLSLIRAFAVLAFCTAAPGRKKISRRDFEEKFPALRVPGLPAGFYYLDSDPTTGRVRLGLVCVDQGAGTRRLVRRVRNEVERRRKSSAWADYLRGGHFVISLVTATPQKAQRLGRSLDREAFAVRVESVPSLVQLMAREEG